jgi:hypothetical protein
VAIGIDERARRIGKNEALFREINERLEAVNDGFSSFSGTMEIVCECGDIACAQQLSVSPAEYENIRSDPTWFAIIPGHQSAGVEHVVTSREGYDIVQKRAGAAAAQARATDPRA